MRFILRKQQHMHLRKTLPVLLFALLFGVHSLIMCQELRAPSKDTSKVILASEPVYFFNLEFYLTQKDDYDYGTHGPMVGLGMSFEFKPVRWVSLVFGSGPGSFLLPLDALGGKTDYQLSLRAYPFRTVPIHVGAGLFWQGFGEPDNGARTQSFRGHVFSVGFRPLKFLDIEAGWRSGDTPILRDLSWWDPTMVPPNRGPRFMQEWYVTTSVTFFSFP